MIEAENHRATPILSLNCRVFMRSCNYVCSDINVCTKQSGKGSYNKYNIKEYLQPKLVNVR